jgi:hypothetical protein
MLYPRAALRPPRRLGYTLVEMMVAAAVSILIMVILTGAFQSGLDTFRNLRVQGNLMERVRMARALLADDLASPHFVSQNSGDAEAGSSAKDYLSGQDLTKADKEWNPPDVGYFRIWQGPDPGSGGLPFMPEGSDGDNLLFARATTHALSFTVRRRGAGPEHMFRTFDMIRPVETYLGTAPNPAAIFPRDFIDPIDYRSDPLPNVFASQWTEVAYFLAPNGGAAAFVDQAGNISRTPLFNLYRRQMLLLPPAMGPTQKTPPPPPMGPPYLPTDQRNLVPVDPVSNPTSPPGAWPAGTFNPEISFRTQFKRQVDNGSPTYRYYFNRAGQVDAPPTYPPYPPPPAQLPIYGSVTQPRNRFGMQAAHEIFQPVPNGPEQSVDMTKLAGIPTGPSFQKIYPTVADDLATYDQSATSLDNRISNDLVLSDVLSFEIKVFWETADPKTPAPQSRYTIGGQNADNPDYPFDVLPLSPDNSVFAGLNVRVFDTWSKEGPYGVVENAAAVAGTGPDQPNWQRRDANPSNPNVKAARLPLRIRVRAILVRLRIWDPKAEKVRQITLMQDV